MSYPPPPDQSNQGGYQYDPYGGQAGSQPPSPQQPGYGSPQQQPGYGSPQQAYGQPGMPPQMPPAYTAAPVAQPSNGMGVAALVLGILGLTTGWIPGVNYVTWIMSLLAIIFGGIGISKANKGEATNKGMAITGLVLGCIAFALAIIVIVLAVAFFASATTAY